jgi:hypothetical protein
MLLTCVWCWVLAAAAALQDITILNIFNGGLIADQVAGQYDRKQLFGAAALEQLQQGVPVAG